MQKRLIETSRIRVILFDLDGTLVDSASDLVESVQSVRASIGLTPLPYQTVSGNIGDGARKLLERSLPEGADLDAAMHTFRIHYRDHCLDRTRPYAGVEALLEALVTRGVALAVCTNKPVGFTETILDGLGLTRFFGVVLGGDSVSRKKPDPEMLREALRQLGEPASAAVMVGDGHTDVRAGRALSIPVVGIGYGIYDRAKLAALSPDLMVDSVAALTNALLGSERPATPGR